MNAMQGLGNTFPTLTHCEGFDLSSKFNPLEAFRMDDLTSVKLLLRIADNGDGPIPSSGVYHHL